MSTPLPDATDFTASTVTEGQFKDALTRLTGYLTGLFGTDGSQTTALQTLGAATPTQMLSYVNTVAADRVAAESAANAARSAWSAALASNPDLNPAFHMNPSTIKVDITVPAGYNAYSSGPLTVGEGVNISLADSSNLTII